MYICSAAAIPPHFISLFLASLRMRAWGFLLQVSGRAHRCGSRQVHRLRLCARSSSSAAETQPANNSLLEHYHMDRGFFRGSGLLLALSGAAVLVPTETKGDVMAGTVRTFRSLGVSEQAIPDAVLLHDHFRRNFLAMYNNALSCPTFYFLWHLIHGAGAATSAVRALTGTARVVPFLVGLYGSAACTTPFLTVGLMRRGQEYKPASKNAAAAVMLSGVAVFESLVELRGCGVAFGNMTPVAVGLFIPAIIGRLAAGVLVQQQKVGTEFQSVVPADWKAAGGARSSVYDLSTTLCIDSVCARRPCDPPGARSRVSIPELWAALVSCGAHIPCPPPPGPHS